jgi:peptidoglycan DL-endopeptidase CwlO
MLKMILLPVIFALGLVLTLPFISYSPGFAVTDCHLTKIGPNAPKDAVYPPGCLGGGNQKVLELARAQLGKPYEWAAPSPRSRWFDAGENPASFDCSGLVGWAWSRATDGRVNYPSSTRGTWPTAPAGFEVIKTTDPAQMKPADAVYFGPSDNGVHHVGLFIGQGECGSNDCFIHAPKTGDVVKIQSLSVRKDILGVVRPTGQ